MGRVAKLVCVEIDNKGVGQSNKFYNITENADGSLHVLRGRVGVTEIVENPNSSWTFDKLVASKLKKGYKDITSLKAIGDSSSTQSDIFNGIQDQSVIKLMKFLMESSKNVVKTNYLVATDDVTKKQIEEAQTLINQSIQYIRVNGNTAELNRILIKLYTILPRKMKNVKDYLANSLNDKYELDNVRKLIDNEQSLLSTLESQILSNAQTIDTTKDNKNILDEMGIEVSVETDIKMLDKINYFLGENKKFAKNIYKVTNHSTQKKFDEHVSKSANKEIKLLWHGSRNENFLGILQKGLMIRPANAIITGAMFGNGAYTSNRSQKSLGYSSLSGSYWANGNSNKGFLALFDVHTGNAFNITKHDSSCYNLHNTIPQKGYDSVYAHKGADLKNDEFITYDVNKTTIRYIIEMEK